jgi:hypothetical protein
MLTRLSQAVVSLHNAPIADSDVALFLLFLEDKLGKVCVIDAVLA